MEFNHTMKEWFSSPLGKALIGKEAKLVQETVQAISSPIGLQLGPVNGDWLRESNTIHRIHLFDAYLDAADGYALPEALPIAADAVNLVVMPHTLDYCFDAKQVLRETHRVLMAEGKLIIVGFNPLSSWGARHLFSNRAPWNAHFIRLGRVKEWLRVLGFEISGGSMIYYSLPTQNDTLSRACEWMEAAGDRWWPMLAAAYCIVATKREIGLTPIKPEWRLQSTLFPGITEPVTRNGELIGKDL